MTPYLSALVLSFLLCLGLTPLAMRLAKRLDFIDYPNTALKVHAKPVPYLGGLAIFLAFALSVLATKVYFFPAISNDGWLLDLHLLRGVYAILAGGLAALILGLVDDARALSPKVKFLGQLLAALMLVFFGLRLRFVENQWLSALLTVLWVAGVTNAMNFVDIMDGLCAGVGGIAALGFFFFALNAGRFNDALPAAALAGSLLRLPGLQFFPGPGLHGGCGLAFHRLQPGGHLPEPELLPPECAGGFFALAHPRPAYF